MARRLLFTDRNQIAQLCVSSRRSTQEVADWKPKRPSGEETPPPPSSTVSPASQAYTHFKKAAEVAKGKKT